MVTIRMPFRTLAWEGGIDGRFIILDQRKLPREKVEIELATVEQVFDAIQGLAVRGAPALGAAAGYGLVVAARRGVDAAGVRARLAEGKSLIERSRPTARNLFWALDRVAAAARGSDRESLLASLLAEAQAIETEDRAACMAIGRLALAVLPRPIRAMTHCNAGALASCGIGTALAPLYVAHAQGLDVAVWAGETRPLLQGARLTAWELSQAGIPVTLLADSARAHLLKLGRVNCIIVGADRIARNGDTANKIGTYDLAVLAHRHRLPFMVAAPSSTFDRTVAHGGEIPIEERSRDEVVTLFSGERIAPEGVTCFNPAFDVTPAELITAIVMEKGVARPPFERSLGELLSC
jgi:methylthioribose-1-phosphate isomerase